METRIIDAIVSGDARAARELFLYVVPSMDRSLLRVFGRREQDHDDFLQTALEQLVETLATHRFARACSLTSWASTIAARVGLAVLRRRYVERRVFQSDPLQDVPGRDDLERQLMARSEIERVRWALAQVSLERARVLFLHDVEGHDLSEIAAMMDSSVAAVQSRLVRGRKHLLKLLKEGES